MNTNETYNKLGLVIAGCKGGYKIFCHNGSIDLDSPATHRTVHDLREFIRYRGNKLNTFSLQFLQNHKVFTLYRSSYDGGSGAFVAISLYVPNDIRIQNAREVLVRMMDTYFKEYIDPMSCSHLPGTYHDIKPFVSLLNSLSKVDKEPRKQCPVISTATPKIRIYARVDELDDYFQSPYRKEFFEGKEIFFLPREMYAHIDDLMRFEQPMNLIDSVSDPEPLPKLTIHRKYWSSIKSVKINGQEVEKTAATPVGDYDEIEIVFQKEHHEDVILKRSVENLKRDGVLSVKERKYDLNIEDVYHKPIRYSFKVTLDGKEVKDHTIVVGLTKQPDTYIDQSSAISVSGDDVTQPLYWGIKIKDNESPVVSTVPINLEKLLKDNIYIVNLESIEREFTVKNDEQIETDLILKCSSFSLRFQINGKKEELVSFLLPTDLKEEEFKLACDKANCKVNKKNNNIVVTLEVKPKEYRLVLPDGLAKDCKWYVKFEGNERHPTNGTVPLKDHHLNKAKLFIKDGQEEYEVNYQVKGTELLPKGYLIKPAEGLYDVQVDVDTKTFYIKRWHIFNEKPKIDPNFYYIDTAEDGNLSILTLSKKDNTKTEATNVSSSAAKTYPPKNSAKASSHNTIQTGSQEVGVSGSVRDGVLKVRFENCKNARINDVVITEDTQDIELTTDSILMLEKNKACNIPLNEADYQNNPNIDDANRKNGFKVKYYSGARPGGFPDCIVTYEGKPKFSHKSYIWYAAVLILILVGGLGWFLWPMSRPRTAVTVKFDLPKESDSPITEIAGVTHADTTSEALLISIDNKSNNAINLLYDEKVFQEQMNGNMEEYVKSLGENKLVFKWKIPGDSTNFYTETHFMKNLWSTEDSSKISSSMERFINKKKMGNVTVYFRPEALKEYQVLNSPVKNEKGETTDKTAMDTISFAGLIEIAKTYPILNEYLKPKIWEKVDTTKRESLQNYIDLKKENLTILKSATSLKSQNLSCRLC